MKVKGFDQLRRAMQEAAVARTSTAPDRPQFIGQPVWYELDAGGIPMNAPLNLLTLEARGAPPELMTVVLAPVRQARTLRSNVELLGNSAAAAFFPGRVGAFGSTAPNVYDGNTIARIRWGDGRITQEAWFNYPVAGAVFSLRASSVVIDVAPQDPEQWSGTGDVPAFAASLLPGAYDESTPLWLQYEPPFTMAAGVQREYAIPPFARFARIGDQAASLATWRCDQLDSFPNVVAVDFRTANAAAQTITGFDVPLVGQARTLRLVNIAAVTEQLWVAFRISIG